MTNFWKTIRWFLLRKRVAAPIHDYLEIVFVLKQMLKDDYIEDQSILTHHWHRLWIKRKWIRVYVCQQKKYGAEEKIKWKYYGFKEGQNNKFDFVRSCFRNCGSVKRVPFCVINIMCVQSANASFLVHCKYVRYRQFLICFFFLNTQQCFGLSQLLTIIRILIA